MQTEADDVLAAVEYLRSVPSAADFRFSVTEIIADPEKRKAAARLHSHPLTDKGGGDYQQYCGWFIYFDDDDKITRVAQYDDTKLMDDMTLRVATVKMRALQ